MSNEIDFDTPEEFGGGGQFLDAPGIYHCLVQSILNGETPKGTAIDGFCITLEVLAGNVEGQVGKTINLTYFNPKINDSEKKAKLTKQQRSKLFIATNLLDPSRKGQSVKISLDQAKDQQLVARFEVDDYHSGEGKTYLQIANAELDVWHVDDPNAKSCPKNEKALALIPKQLRRGPEFFEAIYKKKAAPASAAAGAGSASAGSSPVAGSRVNLDDL